jgi:tetratricopeptide (TPR) repeat protein
VLNVEQNNGEVWASLGQCYLAVEDLGKAYNSFQQALYYLQNPKSAKLWFNIGLLYDRYYSFDHAEEAFTSVLKIDPQYEA